MAGISTRPFVVLTRPDASNDRLASRLRNTGLHTLAMPAWALRPLAPQPGQVPAPCDYDLIVFVSGNAVRCYLDQFLASRPGDSWPAHTWLATVGPASAQALYSAGFIDRDRVLCPDPGQSADSEALWQVLKPRLAQFKRVLIVRGETGRDLLGRMLEEAGASVQRYAAYRREPACWSDQQIARLNIALESHPSAVCLLTSSESVDAMYGNTQSVGLARLWRQSRFVVIHQRIAGHLQSLLGSTSGKVCRPMIKICPPNDDAIFTAIVSIASL